MAPDMGAMIVGGIFMVISTLVGGMLKKKFAKYSKIQLKNGLSGREVAENMLADNGITDVKVVSVAGQLTDHYNPANRTVNLSEVVYNQVNASAAAVAAHECGHAVQHATAYSWLTMRSKLVPAVNISSKVMKWVILIGVAIASATQNTTVLMIGIALFAVTTLFSFVTLPVEFDASRRALVWMTDKGVVTTEEHAGAKDALKWAAMTYVAAALGSLATLIYYITRYMGRR